MRRVIEELITRRSQHQNRVSELMAELENLSGKRLLPGRTKKIALICSELQRELMAWVTSQDREWDAYASNHATMVFKSLQWKIGKLEAEYAQLRSLLTSFATLEVSLKKTIASLPVTEAKPDHRERLENLRERLSVFQYADFEHRFRGSEEELGKKLSAYLPFFDGRDDILDLGCGRGEFLELLRRAGKKARGIDLSYSMLEIALAKGLDCRQQDALAYLESCPGGSIGGVFAAQVIEHLSPEYLQELLLEAGRVLRPGGVILLETINPLSLFALSRIYYLDPSHRQPLHPEFMRYLLESAGFSGVDVVFSETGTPEKLAEMDPALPQAAVFNGNVDKLNELLFNAPEYAVKGYKP